MSEEARSELAAARRRIEDLDEQIIALVAQRVQAGRAAGQAKQRLGLPTVDFARERHVVDRIKSAALRHGVAPDVAQEVLQPLIAAASSRQEADRILAAATGRGRTAVVVGGAGRMGRWFVRFLQDTGFTVHVLDPASAPARAAAEAALPTADLVLVAIPPAAVAELYASWAARPPKGVVLDVASVKAPMQDGLRLLQDAGATVGSFHPLFGPSLVSLRGADVLLCRTGDPKAEQAVRDLFAPTCANVVEVDLDRHDAWMADLLALSHATAIAYAAARGAGLPVHSTTEQRLALVADQVTTESPQVYYEIQAGNPHAPAAVARLADAVDRLQAAVARRDPKAFADLMAPGVRP